MKLSNKILSLFLSVIMIFSFVPLTASASTYSGTCGDELEFVFESDTGTLTITGKGPMYNFTSGNTPWEAYREDIKKVVVGDGVTSIGDYAFYRFFNNLSYDLPDSLKAINSYAFASSYNLRELDLPDGIETIGDYAFSANYQLKNIGLPQNLKTIGAYAFASNNVLRSVELPENLKIIGEAAFRQCHSIKSITIPSGVCTINKSTFANCSALSSVIIGENTTTICENAFFSCTNLYDVTLPKSLTTIETKAFASSKLTNLTVCSDIVSCGTDAFPKTLKTVVFNEGVTTIAKGFLEGSLIENVTIPKTLKLIKSNAFYRVTYLDKMYYNGTVADWLEVTIENERANPINFGCDVYFNNEYVTEIVIPEGVTAIKPYAFSNFTQLTGVTIPGTVKTIGTRAFEGCSSLVEVSIGEGVNIIEDYAFVSCSAITKFNIPSTVEAFNYTVLLNNTLTKITVDSNNPYLSTDEHGVLYNKNKTTLITYPNGNTETTYTIPDGVQILEKYAFMDADNLVSLTIPNTLTTFGDYPFYRNYISGYFIINYKGTGEQWLKLLNNNLAYVYHNTSNTLVKCTDTTSYVSGTCGSNLRWFQDIDSNTLTITGAGNMENYDYYDHGSSSNAPWGYRVENLIVQPGVTSIGSYAFYDSAPKTIILSDDITKIGAYAFIEKNPVDIYYEGSEEQWNAISVGENNHTLTFEGATIHYNYVFPEQNYHTHEFEKIIADGNTPCKINYVMYSCECGVSYVAKNSEANQPHNYGEIVITKKPTCATTGTQKATCTVCGTTITQTLPVSHNEQIIPAVKATVTRIGKTEGVKCADCGEILVKQDYISPQTAKAGKTANWYYDKNTKTLTVYGTGATESYIYWKDYYEEAETIIVDEGITEIGNYTFGPFENIKTIILPDGLKVIGPYAYSGSVFKESTLTSVIIPASVTKIDEWALSDHGEIDIYYGGTQSQWRAITKGTCALVGTKATIHYNYVQEHTHSYELEEAVRATCTMQGYKLYMCECNAGYITDIITINGTGEHNYTLSSETAPTCTKHGVANYICEICESSYWEYSANPTGHTLNEDGVCEVCGEKEVSVSHVNTQMLSVEGVLAMVMSLLAKLLSIFTVA